MSDDDVLDQLIITALTSGAGAIRWSPQRKALILKAIAAGRLNHKIAIELFAIEEAELLAWARLHNRHGVQGLRSTRLQQYAVRKQERKPRGASQRENYHLRRYR